MISKAYHCPDLAQPCRLEAIIFFPTICAWQKSEVASHETQGIDSQLLLAADQSLTGRRDNGRDPCTFQVNEIWI